MTHGCKTCREKVMRLVEGRTYECDECGAKWVATEKGVDPA